MSDYGLITKNDDGGVQIDSKFQNFIFYTSGSANINRGMTSIGISSSNLPPLFAMKPPSDYFVSVCGYGRSNNVYNSVKILAGSLPDVHDFSTSISYLVGRVESSQPSESYGLVVYNSEGKMCFHSAYRYLKILSVHNFTLSQPVLEAGNQNFPYVDINHSNISNPYYILTPNWVGTGMIKMLKGPQPPRLFALYKVAVGLKKLSSEKVRVQSYVFDSYISASWPPLWPYWISSYTLLTCNI